MGGEERGGEEMGGEEREEGRRGGKERRNGSGGVGGVRNTREPGCAGASSHPQGISIHLSHRHRLKYFP